jgi:hypothetical protein
MLPETELTAAEAMLLIQIGQSVLLDKYLLSLREQVLAADAAGDEEELLKLAVEVDEIHQMF